MAAKSKQVIHDGHRVRYEKTRINELDEDPRYQRRSDLPSRIKFASGFCRWKAGTVIAVEHENRKKLVDGKDRVREYRRQGVEEIVVQIISGLTDAEIHELFIAANDTRERVTQFDRFRHHYMAQSRPHLDIVSAAAKLGFCVPITDGRLHSASFITGSISTYNHVKAYDILVSIYMQYGYPCLVSTLTVLRQCFCVGPGADLEFPARKGDFLIALARLLSVTGLDHNQMIKQIKKSKANATSIYAEGYVRFSASPVVNVRTIKRHNSDHTQLVLSEIWLGKPWRKHLPAIYPPEL